MSIDSDLPPLTELPEEKFELERWLHVATNDLCEGAKARVRAEVESHFNAAYEEMVREGLIDAAARAWAITALGHPVSARREFNMQHLTTIDIQLLKKYGKWQYKLAAILCVSFALFALFLQFKLVPLSAWNLRMGIYAVLIPLWAFSFFVAAFFAKRWPRFAMGCGLINQPAAFGLFPMNLIWSLHDLGPSNFSPPVSSVLIGIIVSAASIAWLVMTVHEVIIHLPIIRKLSDRRNQYAAHSEAERPK